MVTNKLTNVLKKINNLLLITVFIPSLSLFSFNTLADQPANAAANTNNIEQTELKLHSDLVIKALQLDFYNTRCRGISVAKNFNKVNRLYITKYSITANNFIEAFINPDARAEKEALQIDFKKNLNRLGGCAKAKDQDWIKEIHDTFREQYKKAEKSAWYPEKSE